MHIGLKQDLTLYLKAEQGVYNMLDQLQQTPKFNRMVKLFETLGSRYYNAFKGIDIGPIFSQFTEEMK